MKKILFFLLALTLFCSCSKDDELDVINNASEIVGVWTNTGGSKDYPCLTTLEFKSDGTWERDDNWIMQDSHSYNSGTYTVGNGNLTFIFKETSGSKPWTTTVKWVDSAHTMMDIGKFTYFRK